MKREYNFFPEDEEAGNDNFGFDPEFNDTEDDNCPYLDLIAAMVLQDKPLGIMWTKDKILEFLKARGYKILDRKDSDGSEYTIAVKPDSSSIPSEGHSNIKEVFDAEIQDIFMKWILRIAKENDNAE